ncbi:hypothetical protein E3J62_09070 [candidate division TA06 bacterium]|uniref:DUF3098 domain-containing protein n=1 Tax=candidate division TA06 bacterium TaxID=2250710 RepID=A0A523UQV4_UNCT6|nr:MAG: hypothetical protein E3J62_09070 [candidate division TA06 bacterium]
MGKKKKAAKEKRKKDAKRRVQKSRRLQMVQFGPKNYVIGAAGLLSILLGFLSLYKGSITLAPILLVLGYCIIVPIALLIK